MSDLSTDNNLLGKLGSDYGVQEKINKRKELDKDAFLSILVTQLQYQDPTKPMEDTQFIAQLAQFSSLEQMQNINTNTIEGNANNMIGKFVSYTTYNTSLGSTEEITGFVTGTIKKENGDMYLVLETGAEVAYEDVEESYTDSTINGQLNGIQGSLNLAQNLALIGKSVQCYEYDENGKAVGYFEGTIDSVKFKDGNAVFIIGNKEVSAAGVFSISDKDSTILGKEVVIGGDTHTIDEVAFVDGVPKLSINGELYDINSIQDLPTALANVGSTINIEGSNKKITGVTISEGDIYLIAEDGNQYGFDDIL